MYVDSKEPMTAQKCIYFLKECFMNFLNFVQYSLLWLTIICGQKIILYMGVSEGGQGGQRWLRITTCINSCPSSFRKPLRPLLYFSQNNAANFSKVIIFQDKIID